MAKDENEEQTEAEVQKELHAVFLQAAHGFRVRRESWPAADNVTGDGKGGFIMQDGKKYKPVKDDSKASDWVVL